VTLLAVLDYGIGNLRSAQKALQHVGADARLTADPGLIRDAAGVVLPGVGAFGRCMEALRSSGLDELAHEAVASGRPFLGICVGMQLLYERSEETPGVTGLGVLPGTVRWLPAGVKRPQMQWNVLDVVRPTPLFDGLDDPAWVYFVHSFAAEDPTHVVATCDYGGPVCAAVERDNVFAAQFHPEKSAANGLRLLANFVALAAAGSPSATTSSVATGEVS
jgi:glutamine amidotransferase